MVAKGSRTGAQQAVGRARRKGTGRQRKPRGARRTAPSVCEGRRTAENTWTQASPLSAGACSPAAREVSQREQRGRRWNGARRGGQDGQLFSVKEAREVRFVQALVRSAGDGLVEPGE